MRTIIIALCLLILPASAQAHRWVPPTLDGIQSTLKAKAQEIIKDCHSTVASGVRHTRVAGRRFMSQHANGTAVDLKGNPNCIYAHLRDWTSKGGGYSVDYNRMAHVHISYGGREAGLAFRHGGGHRARHHRYAHKPAHHKSRAARFAGRASAGPPLIQQGY